MEHRLASRIRDCAAPAVAQTLRQAQAMEAEGFQMTYLLRGEPDFNTPEHIRAAAATALQEGRTHYPPIQGTPELRSAVARRYGSDYGLHLDPDEEVLITTGATTGLYIAVMALVDPGDEVILPDPVYDPYSSLIRAAGGTPVWIRGEQNEGHFTMPLEQVRAAMTDATKAVLINNPWNPTGTVVSEAELQQLLDLAASAGIILIVDEIYENIVFDSHAHHSIASLAKPAGAPYILVNSLSKTYAMTGWRLGYNIAPPILTQAMRRILEQLSRSAAMFVQDAGVAALEGSQDPTDRMRQVYQHRRDLILERLQPVWPVEITPPMGTFFYFLDVRPFAMTSAQTVEYLMREAHVVTVPGSAYGSGGEGFIRISFAYDEDTLVEGAQSIARALGKAQG